MKHSPTKQPVDVVVVCPASRHGCPNSPSAAASVLAHFGHNFSRMAGDSGKLRGKLSVVPEEYGEEGW